MQRYNLDTDADSCPPIGLPGVCSGMLCCLLGLVWKQLSLAWQILMQTLDFTRQFRDRENPLLTGECIEGMPSVKGQHHVSGNDQ
jgi:hypothetical protein